MRKALMMISGADSAHAMSSILLRLPIKHPGNDTAGCILGTIAQLLLSSVTLHRQS